MLLNCFPMIKKSHCTHPSNQHKHNPTVFLIDTCIRDIAIAVRRPSLRDSDSTPTAPLLRQLSHPYPIHIPSISHPRWVKKGSIGRMR